MKAFCTRVFKILQVCPTDKFDSVVDSTPFAWTPGTWWIYVQAKTDSKYTLTGVTLHNTRVSVCLSVCPSICPVCQFVCHPFFLPLTVKGNEIPYFKPPQDMSWCAAFQNLPHNYTCLRSDIATFVNGRDLQSVSVRTWLFCLRH